MHVPQQFKAGVAFLSSSPFVSRSEGITLWKKKRNWETIPANDAEALA